MIYRRKMQRRRIYVETRIRASMESVWSATQDPAEHVRWDIRFSRIEPSGMTDAGATTFTYERSVPLHRVRGEGVSLGETSAVDGARTSALRFSTADRLSPIRAGRGYWRYLPDDDGVRFVTGYDYSPGWGIIDVAVRPLIGWATAWSFDRLRIWLEGGRPPEQWPLASALWFWRADRPRASRCRRVPVGGRRSDDHLADAPSTLATLPDPASS